MQLDTDKYDVVVLGTGLAESIAAAALAKSGKTVLHLDPNEYYGGEQASLTLDELISWTEQRSGSGATETAERSVAPESASGSSTGTSVYAQSQAGRYTCARATAMPESLAPDRRRYAISLFPALMPGRGALVQTLISSDVSKYVSFRLLDGVSIWESDAGGGVFRRVPGSKEEVFKDKSISLQAKRRLMKSLMFAGGEFEEDEQLKGHENEPILEFLIRTFSLSPRLGEAIAYAIAHAASPTEPARPALTRARRYLRSIGRYGPSAFLVGQYGGAGEVAQGFCRACAVFGGTYVLGPEASPSSISVVDGGVSLSIPGHPSPITATNLVSSSAYLPASLEPRPSTPPRITTTARMIAVVKARPILLQRTTSSDPDDPPPEDDDTAVVVFPPTSSSPLVRALIMGEGTGSCPTGQWLIYLWADTSSTHDASELLSPFLGLLAPGGTEFEASYLEHRTEPSAAAAPPGIVRLEPYGGPHTLTEGMDWEAEQAEKAFWAVVGDSAPGKGFFEKDESDEGVAEGDE